MDHWDFTEAIKLAAKKSRRLEAKSDIKEGVDEYKEDAIPKSSAGPEE
jgi:hypothetical protein